MELKDKVNNLINQFNSEDGVLYSEVENTYNEVYNSLLNNDSSSGVDLDDLNTLFEIRAYHKEGRIIKCNSNYGIKIVYEINIDKDSNAVTLKPVKYLNSI